MMNLINARTPRDFINFDFSRFVLFLNLFIADKIMATLGEGTFGRVVKVKDMQM